MSCATVEVDRSRVGSGNAVPKWSAATRFDRVGRLDGGGRRVAHSAIARFHGGPRRRHCEEENPGHIRGADTIGRVQGKPRTKRQGGVKNVCQTVYFCPSCALRGTTGGAGGVLGGKPNRLGPDAARPEF